MRKTRPQMDAQMCVCVFPAVKSTAARPQHTIQAHTNCETTQQSHTYIYIACMQARTQKACRRRYQLPVLHWGPHTHTSTNRIAVDNKTAETALADVAAQSRHTDLYVLNKRFVSSLKITPHSFLAVPKSERTKSKAPKNMRYIEQ